MSFEEEFPSLKDYVIEDYEESEDDWNRFKISIGDVQKHTIDKKLIIDIIFKGDVEGFEKEIVQELINRFNLKRDDKK